MNFLSQKIVSSIFRFGFGLLLALVLPSGTQLYQVRPGSAPLSPPSIPSLFSEPPDYTMDVEDWWAVHPFNPQSPTYIKIGAISSPSPIVNVQEQFAGNIQAAINALPSTGGSLFFEPGTYQNNFQLIGKSNVHFISDGGAVFTGGPGKVVGCQQALDYTAIAQGVHSHNSTSIACITTDRIQNIYFKNIVFDGAGTAINAVLLSAAKDVVFDSVTFQNFHDPETFHHGVVNGNVNLENIWFRGVHFAGRERWVIYLDGAHFSGVVQSQIDFNFGDMESSSGGLLFMANNDLNGDYNQNGIYEPDEKRNANYIVIANNLFGAAGGSSMHTGMAISGANVLIQNNTVLRYIYRFALLNGKCDAINSGVDLRFINLKLIGNRIKSADIFAHIDAGKYACEIKNNTMGLGRYVVRDNRVDAESIPALVWETNPPLETPNLEVNNCVGGKLYHSNIPCTYYETFLPGIFYR